MRLFEQEITVNGRTHYVTSTIPITPKRLEIYTKMAELNDEAAAIEHELQELEKQLRQTQPEYTKKSSSGAMTYGTRKS